MKCVKLTLSLAQLQWHLLKSVSELFFVRRWHLQHSLETCSSIIRYLWNKRHIYTGNFQKLFHQISEFYCCLPMTVFHNRANTCSVELTHSKAVDCSGDSCGHHLLWMFSSDQSRTEDQVSTSGKFHSFSPKCEHIHPRKSGFFLLRRGVIYWDITWLTTCECSYTVLPCYLKTTL